MPEGSRVHGREPWLLSVCHPRTQSTPEHPRRADLTSACESTHLLVFLAQSSIYPPGSFLFFFKGGAVVSSVMPSQRSVCVLLQHHTLCPSVCLSENTDEKIRGVFRHHQPFALLHFCFMVPVSGSGFWLILHPCHRPGSAPLFLAGLKLWMFTSCCLEAGRSWRNQSDGAERSFKASQAPREVLPLQRSQLPSACSSSIITCRRQICAAAASLLAELTPPPPPQLRARPGTTLTRFLSAEKSWNVATTFSPSDLLSLNSSLRI